VPAEQLKGLFTYAGEIVIPGGSATGYGGNGIHIDGDKLYLGVKDTNNTMLRMDLPPSLGGTATVDIGRTVIPGSVSTGGENQYISGCYVHRSALFPSGRLFITKSDTYDAGGMTSAIGNTADLDMGNVSPMVSFNALLNGLTNQRVLAAQMGPIPEDWQPIFNGDTFLLGGRLSIITQSCEGYGFSAFYAADMPDAGGAVPIQDWLWYNGRGPSNEHQHLEPYGTSDSQGHWDGIQGGYNEHGGNDYFTQTNAQLGTAVIIPNSRTIVFIASTGVGIEGTKDSGGCRDGSSTQNDPFRLQIVAYDIADIINANNPWEPFPYALDSLEGSEALYGHCVGDAVGPGCFTYDEARNWLVGSNGWQDSGGALDVWNLADWGAPIFTPKDLAGIWSWTWGGAFGHNLKLMNQTGDSLNDYDGPWEADLRIAKDMSGNGNDYTFQDAPRYTRPVTVGAFSSDFPALATQGFGSQSMTQSGSLGAAGAFYLAAVVVSTRSDNVARYLWGTSTDRVLLNPATGEVTLNTTVISQGAVSGPMLIEVWRDEANAVVCMINGVDVTLATPSLTGLFNLSGIGGPAGAPDAWDDYHFEFVACSLLPGSSQRAQLRSYLNNKWSIY
jgi:hypothetical protein